MSTNFRSSLAFLAVTTLYLQLLPIGIETQPVLACFLIILNAKYVFSKGISISVIGRLLSMFIFIVTLYALLGSFTFGFQSYISAFKILLPPLFFLSLNQTPFRLPDKLVAVFISLHLLLLLLISFDCVGFLSIFLDRWSAAKGGELGNGISFFSQEPSYAAMYLFSAFVAIYCGLNTKRTNLYCTVLIILMIVTKSALGFLMATLAFMLLYGINKRLLIFLPFLIFLFLSYLPSDFRILAVISALTRLNPDQILESIMILEPSGTTRLLKNIPALYYGVLSIFGHGVGSFEVVFSQYAQHIELYRSHELLSDLYYNGGSVTPDSYLAYISFEMGFAAVPFYAAVLLLLSRLYISKKHFFFALLAFILFNFQSQITNPMLLFILYALNSHVNSSNPDHC